MNCPKCGASDVAMLGFGAHWKCYACFEISADAEMVGTTADRAMSEKTKAAILEMAKAAARAIEHGEITPDDEAWMLMLNFGDTAFIYGLGAVLAIDPDAPERPERDDYHD